MDKKAVPEINDGFNNEKHPLATLIGGDNGDSLPLNKEVKDKKKANVNKPNYEVQDQVIIKSGTTDKKYMVKNMEIEELGGDKVDIISKNGAMVDKKNTDAENEYVDEFIED
jgi:hypothetical protein